MEPRPRVLVVLLSLALAAAALSPAAAQLEPVPPPRPAPPPEPEPEPEPEPPIVVTDAFVYYPEVRAVEPIPQETPPAMAHAAAAREAAMEDGEYKTIQLSGLVAVQVSDLAKLAGEAYEDCGQLRLAFDRAVFGRYRPSMCTGNLVVFNLDLIDRGESPAWEALIGKRDGVFAHASISLWDGENKVEILPAAPMERKIRLYNWRYGIVAAVGLVLILWVFFLLARQSNMLRDGGKKRVADEPLRPYSLARSQTAWWFFLVLASFLFISLISGSLVEIPGSVLGLMGIAGGTFLGSELIDSSNRNKRENRDKPSPVAAGFFADIFSDAGGVAFHRFQMFVWTLALGIIFVIRVFRNLAMPEFDTSILGLMGISSGTYLGMKVPENPKGEGVDNAPPPPA